MIDLEMFKELYEEAAQGEWYVKRPHPENACAYIGIKESCVDVATLYGGYDKSVRVAGKWSEQPIRDATASLIVEMRNALPEIIKQLELYYKLKKELDN